MLLKQYRLIGDKIDDEIKAVLAKHGFKVTKRTASVGEHDGSLRLTINAVDVNAGTNPDRERFKREAFILDMDPDWIDKTFDHGGQEYRVTGLKNWNTKTAGKKIVLVERVSDKSGRVAEAKFVIAGFKKAGVEYKRPAPKLVETAA